MRVDVSEIKTFRHCPRKWQFSSRNQMHLRPTVTPRHFTFGTIFHEALHQLYLGASADKVLDWVQSQIDPNTPSEMALPSMIRGYIDNLLADDLQRYQILEVEHQFSYPISYVPAIDLCGSIDMLAIERKTNTLYGFEHKTCKNFRTGAYLALDDQLRVYNWILYQIAPTFPSNPKVGGVILNETRKLLRQFDNKRHTHNESLPALQQYINTLRGTTKSISSATETPNLVQPCADFMSCQMCEFATICETYGTQQLPPESQILEEFELEFQKRECDHLDEKVEREVMQ